MKKTEVRVVPWGALTDPQIAAWDALELRSLDQNVYLSPHFVLPALRYLERSNGVLAVLIEEHDSTNTVLIGFGLFEPASGTRRFPLPHLCALRTRHSFETGLLLDPDHAAVAMEAFIQWCTSDAFAWHGIAFPLWPTDGGGGLLLKKICSARQLSLAELDRTQRATLIPSDAGDAYVQKQVGASRLKELRRKERRLSELGGVSWTVLSGEQITDEVVQRFIDLEDAGWKGEKRTSIKSGAGNEKFFRSMARGLAQRGRAIFTEISVGDRVISSTCNFMSGRAGFAFKLGWHPDFAKYSPGILNELEIVRNAPQLFSGMEYLDSGASAGSFMDQIWAGRRSVAHIIIPTSQTGRMVLFAMGLARKLKRHLSSRQSTISPQ